ncbi:hypothetical protein ASA_P5G156 (plasmid) [Aeromonas salmonicida subsp. salmonicida A449]|uniref:Uncharacterized protein n=1 Tax=Aeromonas salmonicida (strain A449) TaxID=382245 RepID=A4SUQ1_AERS4|nr:hypothetical protein ASA_P5G156 [Aeromonas salmonicida subsp. salmonicida A449]
MGQCRKRKMKWQNLRQVYTGRGGVVVVYRGEGQGWVNEL